MSAQTARNIAIIAALGVVVWLAPGGGSGANLVLQLLSAAFIVGIVLIGARMYQQFHSEIYGLGDTWRFALYAACGVALVTVAASNRLFKSAAGSAAWFVLIAGASGSVYLVWRRYRAYE